MRYVHKKWSLAALWVLFCAIAKSSGGLIELNPPIQAGRVVGGTDAVANSASFIVSLQYKGIHYCGGSIINNNWILTAAHCLRPSSVVKETMLVAGSIYVAGTSSTTQRRVIDYYTVNDLYVGDTSPYDVGLVYTKTPFIWSNAVKPIALASSSYAPSGNAILYGWGSTSKNNTAVYPAILQAATVPIISLSACEKAMGTKGSDVHSTNLCTGPLTGGFGICSSDSGGPLIQIIKGNHILVGVVSWGKLPCGQTNSPSVYVKVSSVLPWIEKNQVTPK